MVIAEMKRVQVLAGILNQYEDYVPDLSHIQLTEEELSKFESEWKLIEESILDEKLDPRILQVGKIAIRGFRELAKKFLVLIKGVGKLSQWFTNTVIGVAKWMWRNKWGVAIAAGLGLQHQMIVNGLDKIYDVLPEKILGWFGADTSFGQIFQNWTESGLKNGWNQAIDYLRSFETTSIVDMPRDVLTEYAAGIMDIIGTATPILIDVTIQCWQALSTFGFYNLGIITSWMFMIGILLNAKDWLWSKGAPLQKYLINFFNKSGIEKNIQSALDFKGMDPMNPQAQQQGGTQNPPPTPPPTG